MPGIKPGFLYELNLPNYYSNHIFTIKTFCEPVCLCHTQLCSVFPPSSVLRDHSLKVMGGLIAYSARDLIQVG